MTQVEAASATSARDGVIAIWAHRRLAEQWHVPPLFRVVAWMGGVTIDLTNAILPADGAVLELFCFMGVIAVRVPADIEVQLFGDAITWRLEAEPDGPRSSTARRGCVRITGRALLGKVDVCLVGRRRESFACS